MNTAKIKAYAQQARRDFIQAVTEKANMLGLSKDKIEPADVKGDFAIIGGRPFLKSIEKLRQHLIKRIQQDGFELVMRSIAYTWFNRFVALRYMELHDYLDHGYRVLSNRNGSEVPEILEHAVDLDLPGLNKDEVVEFRLAGDKDNELYRLLIFAQCDALNRSMPFLFEKLNHETELLLPDNLLHSNSPIRKLVQDIDEADWENVEVIGWIYQFYISEKKDEVIGKVVKSEDIPAATQLFTPNWIVKYMVQNTLGRQWLATYPDSPLRNQMEFYIEPAEQIKEVQRQIAEITPDNIDPESLTLLDPACGSGHILVEAYDLFKAIYQERGYRKRDIPRLILEKNLYGLEICDRAAQLAGFALMMKARADDRGILNGNSPKLNLMAIQSSEHIDVHELSKVLLKEKIIRFKDDDKLFPDFEQQRTLVVKQKSEVSKEDITGLLNLFRQGKTLGFLITLPKEMSERLEVIRRLIENKSQIGDLFERGAAETLKPFLQQSLILSRKYQCVVVNPPYIGSKGMNSDLKLFAQKYYNDSKSDIFAIFVERILTAAESNGHKGIVMPYVWMFISSYEKFRKNILSKSTINSLIQLEYNAFEPACVPVATFTLQKKPMPEYKGIFIKLTDFKGYQNQSPKTLEAIHDNNCKWRYIASKNDFIKIPCSPIAYWASDRIRKSFSKYKSLSKIAKPLKGFDTGGGSEKFFRYWWEVDERSIYRKGRKVDKSSWVEVDKGGVFRKWYGNRENIVLFKNNGAELYNKKGANIRNKKHYFQPGITFTVISSSKTSFRKSFEESIFYQHGATCIIKDEYLLTYLLGLSNSKIAESILAILCPTLSYTVNDVAKLPINQKVNKNKVNKIVEQCIQLSKFDWDSFEKSWDFETHSILRGINKTSNLQKSQRKAETQQIANKNHMQELESYNNRIFIEAYSLQEELDPEVPQEEITLEHVERATSIKQLISYAIGCMMGRYSLDKTGLIYAHSGNNGFDSSCYKKFPADDDGIIPIMDLDWFPDDAASRFAEFLKVAWSPETLEENLKFVADSLKPKRGETPTDTIRRYLCTNFFKDHLKTYKKRPIYWLFSSGKHKAFECLVYLHRYNESTVSRMRSSYVTPLQGKFNARIDYLHREIEAVQIASAQKNLQKELAILKKKKTELLAFDDELRHYADKRIILDLDDGVKVNYGKFGKLLAEKKTVTG